MSSTLFTIPQGPREIGMDLLSRIRIRSLLDGAILILKLGRASWIEVTTKDPRVKYILKGC